MMSSGLGRVSARRLAHVAAKSAAPLSQASIAELPGRWESMPAAEQHSVVTRLAERQRQPWTELTPAEKQAAWYISYGAWGPRRPVHRKGDAAYITKGVVVGLGAAIGLFALVRMGAADPPKTMNKEWQLKSDEYLKSKNANPWTGYSQVQSK